MVAQPREGFERTVERIAEWHDRRSRTWRYSATDPWEERIHGMIGAPWPCQPREDFDPVWDAAVADLAEQGLRMGRGAFGGWDDGDPGFVRAAWCLARHLGPRRVVETGVARGITTRALLEALERNQRGELWSVDLPPLIESGLRQQTAAAVPERLRDRWTLLRGSSRRMLPSLVLVLGSIDLFVHDSMHTTRNVRFELEHVWPALSPGGAVLIDDVEKNGATADFLERHPDAEAVISTSQDRRVLVACLVKHPSPRPA
jgi:hypothetical protein